MDHLAVLQSTYLTLKAEKVLDAADLNYRTVMKPREISSDCGLAIRFSTVDRERVREALLGAGLVPVRLFVSSEGSWDLVDDLQAPPDGGRS